MPFQTGSLTTDILLIGLLSFAPTVIILAIVFGAIAASARRTRRLLAEGEAAEATVLDVRRTGVRINGRPQVQVVLEVRRLGHPPYQATARQLVAVSASLFAPSNIYPPGTIVEVRVDPANPRRVAVAGPAAGQADLDAARLLAAVAPGGAAQPPAAARLAELKQLLDQGLISEDEYAAKRAAILDRL